ncbi:MAG: hypothetical protein ABTS22_20005 [Accumulibacter sp.]|uniref:hypothetical protein n=1 Tax=Accumulibacter sp. TaxID=2053492 RepID=UPI0033161066
MENAAGDEQKSRAVRNIKRARTGDSGLFVAISSLHTVRRFRQNSGKPAASLAIESFTIPPLGTKQSPRNCGFSIDSLLIPIDTLAESIAGINSKFPAK